MFWSLHESKEKLEEEDCSNEAGDVSFSQMFYLQRSQRIIPAPQSLLVRNGWIPTYQHHLVRSSPAALWPWPGWCGRLRSDNPAGKPARKRFIFNKENLVIIKSAASIEEVVIRKSKYVHSETSDGRRGWGTKEKIWIYFILASFVHIYLKQMTTHYREPPL